MADGHDGGPLGLGVRDAHERPPNRDEPTPPELCRPNAPAKVWITEVTPGSPAAAAGLTVGQTVSAVNGRAVESLGASTLAALLDPQRLEAGKGYVLEVHDGERSRTVRLEASPSK